MRLKTLRLFLTPLALVSLTVGASTAFAAPPSDRFSSAPLINALPSQDNQHLSANSPTRGDSTDPHPTTIDDVFAEVARQVPDFGGMYVDPDSAALYVYLKDQSPRVAAAAEAELYATFGDERLAQAASRDQTPAKPQFRVLPAKYGFLELKGWHERLTIDVLGLPGVVLTDVDDTSNRLTVGVETKEAQDQVEAQLARLGIPLEAVTIEVTEPIVPTNSLRDLHRPVVGGLQISFATTAGTSICTLGFSAVRQGVLGFVTNSHCSQTRSVVDGVTLNYTVYHQSTIAFLGANIIGSERVDPPFFVGGVCPANRRCRYSDALFAEYTDPAFASLGFIARPLLGKTAWNGTDTFRIVRERFSYVGPLVGETVTKVGRTTGRTEGQVTRSGSNSNVANTNITLLAQARADYSVANGDSGSPVISPLSGPASPDPAGNPRNVELVGIHWGSNTTSSVFSPIGNVQFTGELGLFNTCAPPLAC